MFNVKSFQLLYLKMFIINIGGKSTNKDGNTYHDKSQLANEGHLRTVTSNLEQALPSERVGLLPLGPRERVPIRN